VSEAEARHDRRSRGKTSAAIEAVGGSGGAEGEAVITTVKGFN
jgi:hypothetical protein